MMHYFPSNVTEMEQVRGGNGNVTYTGVKTYHQELDQSRNSSSGNGSSGTNYASASKYQQGMTTHLATTRQVNNDQLSEMERAHAKYQIEMEMARQKYQSEIEQAAAKYQSDLEEARGNVGTFINMKYQQVSAEDLDKAGEQEIHYKYQSEMDHAGNRTSSNSFSEVKYQNAFRPSPDLQQQQQQQQQQQTTTIPVNTNYGSPLEYHQSSAANNSTGALNASGAAPPPVKKRKKKPVDQNKIRKRCVYHRRMWTNAEREAVMRQLGDFLATDRLPGKKDIEEALQREDILGTRSWKNIKDFIRNKTSPRISRRSVQSLPTQVPVVQAGVINQSGVTVTGNMVVASTLGDMVTIPITSQGQHLTSIDAKIGLMSAQQQHIQQQQQIQLQQHQNHHQQQHHHQSGLTPSGNKKRKKVKKESPDGKQRRIISRRDWSGAEKNAVLHYFGDYVARQKLPGKKEIEECLQKEDILSFRSWRNVKDFIRNSAQARIKREAIFGTGNPDFDMLS